MRRFLLYTLISVFISAACAYFFYARAGLIYVPKKHLFPLNYCGDSKEYNDIIFIGGSRVVRHINPAIIDSINGTKSYSLGTSGIGIVECNLLLNKYLQNHPKPKAVFLNIDCDMFYTDDAVYNMTNYFSYLDDTLVYNCLSPYKLAYRNKLVQKYYLLQKVFATTDQTKAIHLGIEEPKIAEPNNTINFRGYHPTYAGWNFDAEEQLKNKIKVIYRPAGFELLKRMIEKCRRDSINIILVDAPIYYKINTVFINEGEVIDTVKAIASAANVPYLDYTKMEICKSKDFFTDMVHLNIKGSVIYSLQLAEDIKKHGYVTGKH